MEINHRNQEIKKLYNGDNNTIKVWFPSGNYQDVCLDGNEDMTMYFREVTGYSGPERTFIQKPTPKPRQIIEEEEEEIEEPVKAKTPRKPRVSKAKSPKASRPKKEIEDKFATPASKENLETLLSDVKPKSKFVIEDDDTIKPKTSTGPKTYAHINTLIDFE